MSRQLVPLDAKPSGVGLGTSMEPLKREPTVQPLVKSSSKSPLRMRLSPASGVLPTTKRTSSTYTRPAPVKYRKRLVLAAVPVAETRIQLVSGGPGGGWFRIGGCVSN